MKDGVRVRRRTRVVVALPDSRSARMLACGRWHHGAATRGRLGRSLDMGHLDEREEEKDAHREERALFSDFPRFRSGGNAQPPPIDPRITTALSGPRFLKRERFRALPCGRFFPQWDEPPGESLPRRLFPQPSRTAWTDCQGLAFRRFVRPLPEKKSLCRRDLGKWCGRGEWDPESVAGCCGVP